MVKTIGSPFNHIIFAAAHSICDGKSIAWLLGEILQIIEALEKGDSISPNLMPLPLALSEIIDYAFFQEETHLNTTGKKLPWLLHAPFNYHKSLSKNLFRKINPQNLNNLVEVCRKKNVTFTSAFTAAFALSLFEADADNNRKVFDFCLGVDFRKYTNPVTPNNIFAFYVQPLFIALTLDHKLNFWELAYQAKLEIQRAIKKFNFPQDSANLTEKLVIDWQSAIASQQAFMPPCISNMGKIDAAFEKVSAEYTIEEYFFTVNPNYVPHPLSVFFLTLNNTCFLNFNFSYPSISSEWVERLIDRIIEHLLDAAKL